ncbi:choice-of-anchor J domain-containing protein [Tahibacter amnicola]|uniref:Choice-of-anchor J domain-containing protein n=1 Tax=Tahibacter amnicola TaxID=2976241 RepID=A0ABY6BJF4_9GAMM|nr:choice-of-anchor J domain-containing protein [Tahibacter amnicola]UXI70146.1 choice-of-anchor J domain-containing protein [Tahibacter amnicola]
MDISLRRHALASAVLVVLSSSPALAANVFFEDFQIPGGMGQHGCQVSVNAGGAGTYPFPANWLLRNVDNRTPATNVNYVNDAWEDREDFANDTTDCAAFSTSWYSPAGSADDWMWTPAIAVPAGGANLTWNAITYDPSYPDGYEVRIMASPNVPTGGTGTIGNQLSSSTQLFAIPQENTAWTPRSVSLAAYSGQTVYIGFRNNSNDKFLLLIDDVAVVSSAPDLAAEESLAFPVDYPLVPAGIKVEATLAARARNAGGATLTNVAGTAQPKLDAVAVGSVLPSTNTIASLAVGATDTLSFPSPLVIDAPGDWSATFTMTATETDAEPGNNTLDVPLTSVGGNAWSRFEGAPTGTLGIGAGNGGELGTSFTLLRRADIRGIRFGVGPSAEVNWPGQDLIANVRATDGTGQPTTIIASTVPVESTAEGGIYEVPFVGGAINLQPGTYFVSVAEPVGGPTLPLYVHMQRFESGTNWAALQTPPTSWSTFESFGTGFQRVPQISLLVELSLFRDGFDLPEPARSSYQVAPAPKAVPPLLRKPAPTAFSQGMAR